MSRGTRSRSRSSSVSASLRDLVDEDEGGTDIEEDMSDDDASTNGDDSNLDQEEERSDGAEYALAVGAEDSDDEDSAEVSAVALLGPDASVVPPDGSALRSENAESDIEMVEEEEDGITAADETPIDDGSSPHSDLVATPSTDPLPGSPHSLVPTPRPIVLSPPPDVLPQALPAATHPFSEVLLEVKEAFHPVYKSPATESQVVDMPADSVTPDHDLLAHEVHLAQEKSAPNGDSTIAEHEEVVPTQPISVTYDSEIERPDFPTNGAESGTPPADAVDDDDAGSAIGDEFEEDTRIPRYLKPYAVAPVEWDVTAVTKPPALLRGILRPYQQTGLEWLASIHTRNLNCILADEMGLGYVLSLSFVDVS